jgi:hypothetical protein
MSMQPDLPRRDLLRSAAAASLVVAAGAGADEPPQSKPAPAAKAGDVVTIDAILAALYDVISGPKGQARDWDRMRSLFAPGARLIPCLKDRDGKAATRVLTVEDYITRAGPALEGTGFFENEVARRVDRFGHIAQVFSTYESRREKGAEPFARGINSIQLFWDESRWWVVTIFWDSEAPGQPIPPEYRAKP